VWFFLLTYALSWGWLLPIAVTGGVVVAGRGWPTHVPALLGPLLAACAVTIWHDGRRGLVDLVRRMSRLRARARWWLFAVSPLMVLVVVLIVDAATGRPLPAYGDFAVFSVSRGLGERPAPPDRFAEHVGAHTVEAHAYTELLQAQLQQGQRMQVLGRLFEKARARGCAPPQRR
jgi:hypothetical protein